jgi:hypothetical protein
MNERDLSGRARADDIERTRRLASLGNADAVEAPRESDESS